MKKTMQTLFLFMSYKILVFQIPLVGSEFFQNSLDDNKKDKNEN